MFLSESHLYSAYIRKIEMTSLKSSMQPEHPYFRR